MKTSTKILIILILLAFVDMVIPVPFASILLIYIVLEKPPWFKKIVDNLYG